MRFGDKAHDMTAMVETVCLILSMGAVFLQIWILLSGIESFFEGRHTIWWASVILSGLALLTCALTAWTTTLDFTKGIRTGRIAGYSPWMRTRNDKETQDE